MSVSPIIFIIAVIVLDMALKSKRNKAQEEKSRPGDIKREIGEASASSSNKSSGRNTIREIRMMLEKELQGKPVEQKIENIEENIEKNIEKTMTRDERIQRQREKVSQHSELEKLKRRKAQLARERGYDREPKTAVTEVLVTETQEDKNRFKNDLVKGVIFSEILGKPKSIK